MQQKTHIANVLERNNCKDRYDTQVKQILSDKNRTFVDIKIYHIGV